MRRFYFVFFFCFVLLSVRAQHFSMGELVNFTSYPGNKFDAYISRKGFKPRLDRETPAYYKASKDKALENFIAKQDANDAAKVIFQTNSVTEFNGLKEELTKAGYAYTETKNRKGEWVQLYQKTNVTVQPFVKEEDGKKIYGLRIERKALPRAKDVVHAEDLLQLTSHEYLVAVYGEANVKKDLFYFSEDEVNKCSVLFPNTSMQVIFIWEDEVNSRDVSFIMIGGHLRAQSSLTYHKQIEQNAWRSSQGVYCGMSLKELVKLNEGQVSFYGWESEQPGFVKNQNTGKIDFKRLSVVLNCLDCNEDKYYTGNNVIRSADVLSEGRRVYVSTFIILPTK